jgi:hypothetical protein
MGEPHILTTLRRKRAEIEAVIAAHEAKIEAARVDLAALDKTLRLFEPGAARRVSAYFELARLWTRGEIVAVCRDALEHDGALDSRQLAVRVAAAKGLDDRDAIMLRPLTLRVARALSNARRRGIIGELEKRNGVRVWSVT